MQLLSTGRSISLSYWLNWKVLLCGVWVLIPLVVALYLIWKYEDFGRFKLQRRERQQYGTPALHNENSWRPCLEGIHPAWLLAFRVFSFIYLLTTLILRVHFSGFRVYQYYTQWTFTLLTVYFGFGSLLSIYGCYKSQRHVHPVNHGEADAEQGCSVPLIYEESHSTPETRKGLNIQQVSKATILLTYLFQVMFQVCGGAVVLTDLIYWICIYPFLTIKDYDLNFMTVNLHTSNLVLLLGEAALNDLTFPFFRIAYFLLWTGAYVIFQWILHACVLFRWPYPFLDLSFPNAPAWYLIVAVTHVPTYGVFALVIELKCYLLSKWFPQSHNDAH